MDSKVTFCTLSRNLLQWLVLSPTVIWSPLQSLFGLVTQCALSHAEGTLGNGVHRMMKPNTSAKETSRLPKLLKTGENKNLLSLQIQVPHGKIFLQGHVMSLCVQRDSPRSRETALTHDFGF